MPSSIFVGIAVTASNNNVLSTGVVDSVSLTGTGADFYLTPVTEMPIRVDSATTGQYTDPLNRVWREDFGYSAGSVYSNSSNIANTTTATIYQTIRWHSTNFNYTFNVPNGTYTVVLKFAENSRRIGSTHRETPTSTCPDVFNKYKQVSDEMMTLRVDITSLERQRRPGTLV